MRFQIISEYNTFNPLNVPECITTEPQTVKNLKIKNQPVEILPYLEVVQQLLIFYFM